MIAVVRRTKQTINMITEVWTDGRFAQRKLSWKGCTKDTECEKQRKCGDAKLSCEGKKEVPVGAIHKWGGPCGHL